MKIHVEAIETKNNVYVIVTDPAAGRKSYTVYRIDLWTKESVIIACEFPLKDARKLVKGIIKESEEHEHA